jgi:3-oxoacyl-[acyl-carrier protein] reductase
LSSEGIAVLDPGLKERVVLVGWITAELERAILPTIPLGRIGSPEDVADVIVFLASNQARWLTGHRIYVGGGHGM